MPFVAITDTAKVEVLGHVVGTLTPVAQILHVRLANAAQTPANLHNINTAISTALGGNLNVFSSSYQFDELISTGLATATSPQVADAYTAIGGGASTAVPGMAALTKLLTATRGRSYRGRIYWGVPPANAVNTGTGTLGTIYQGQINTLTAAIETNLAALTPASNLVVASRKLGISTDVTSAQCEPVVAFQRRRNGR